MQCGYGINANQSYLWMPYLLKGIALPSSVSYFQSSQCVSACPQSGDLRWTAVGMSITDQTAFGYNGIACKQCFLIQIY
jgi:hypothetical protein